MRGWGLPGVGPPHSLFTPLLGRTALIICPWKSSLRMSSLILGVPRLDLGAQGIMAQSSGCEYFASSLVEESSGAICSWLYQLGEVCKWHRPHVPMLLQVDCASEIPGGLVKIERVSRGLRMCISNKFLGVVNALGWGPHFENCCHRHLWETLDTTWLHNGLCFYVAGSRSYLGTAIFSFQGITCFLFSVFNPNFLLPPQFWSFCQMSTARVPQWTGEQIWALSHPLLRRWFSTFPPTKSMLVRERAHPWGHMLRAPGLWEHRGGKWEF